MSAIFDLHCDLLSYLATVKGADVYKQDEIGAAVPHLKAGKVKLQVMAAYTDTAPGSSQLGMKQVELYNQLPSLTGNYFQPVPGNFLSHKELKDAPGCFTLLALENAAGFCEEDDPLDVGLNKLEKILDLAGPLAYIILTHHYENRFGGGNYAEAGLKPDGEVLLDFLHTKKIPIDIAHTSDALAYGILNYIDKRGLDVPVITSHSNFRKVHEHPRNLPDELAIEIVGRRGLIGINFLRNYINDQDPRLLYKHIEHAQDIGASDSLALGADFFYALHHPDPSRYPIYFPGQNNASCYQKILRDLEDIGFSEAFCDKIAHKNAMGYYSNLLTG